MNNSVNFREIYRINDYCAVTISFTVNFLLFFLVITKTPKEMSSYKKILLQTCLTDILLTMLIAITEPIVAFKHGNEVIINNGFFRKFSITVDLILTEFWVFCLVFSYCSISVPFLYRYFSLVRKKELTGLSYIYLFMLPITLNTIHVVVGSILFYPSEEKILFAKEEFGEYLLENDMDHISAGLIGLSTRFDTWLVAIDMLVITAGNYAVAFWCNFKIWSYVSENMRHASAKTREMNSQINKTLVAQAIGPLVVNAPPMLSCIICIITKADSLGFSLWMGLPFSWIPIVNPILTIWLIKPYKEAIWKNRNARIDTSSNRMYAISSQI